MHSIVQTQQLKKIQQTETWRKIKWWIVFLMEGLYKPQHRAVAKHTTKKWKNSGLESLNWFADRWAFLSLLYVCYWKKTSIVVLLALLLCNLLMLAKIVQLFDGRKISFWNTIRALKFMESWIDVKYVWGKICHIFHYKNI